MMTYKEVAEIVRISLRDDLIDEKSFFPRVIREKCLEALEKQIQKKPIRRDVKPTYHTYFDKSFSMWVCPICNKAVEVDDNEGYRTEFYPSCECGQRIDWTDILEDYECKWNDYEVYANGK